MQPQQAFAQAKDILTIGVFTFNGEADLGGNEEGRGLAKEELQTEFDFGFV